MFKKAIELFSILTVLGLFSNNLQAQSDTLSLTTDTMSVSLDSLSTLADTINVKSKASKSGIDVPVHYSATDSMTMMVQKQLVYLYKDGSLKYQDINLDAYYIQSDLEDQVVKATGRVDSNNVYQGAPVFVQGSETFNADSIAYGIRSGKGVIYNVKSQQGEGYLHSELTKRDSTGYVHLKGGKYTTCPADHPHFYMELTRAIVIPKDKIISGPAYLVIEDIPIPMLGLPFGFFPNSTERGAGILIPTFSREIKRGFCLRQGGWYQPIGQYADLRLTGDIYTNGSWAASAQSNYTWRYHFRGNARFQYNLNKTGIGPEDETYSKQKQFRLSWSHSQDAKANPTQSFSANVNYSTSGFDQENSTDYNQIVTSQKSSSISFSKNWPGTPFSLAVSANARQNTTDNTVSIDAPTGSFNASTMYPFRKKGGSSGKFQFWQNIGFSYRSSFYGQLNTIDTMITYREPWQNMDKAFKHSIPIVLNLKIKKLKMLTISPSLSYQGRLYDKHINRSIVPGSTGEHNIVSDTVSGLVYAHAINPGMSVSLSPKIYGMYTNTRKGEKKVVAIRHTLQPRASFSFTPDMNGINPNYYNEIFFNENGQERSERYSRFDGFKYGTPTGPTKSGRVSLSLGNNLEMKMAPKNDTTGEAEDRKIVLIRNLNASTSYNPFAEKERNEYAWSDVRINGSTALFNNKLSVNANSGFTPYDMDTLGRKINEFYYTNKNKILRFQSLSFNASFSLKSKQGGNDEEEGTDELDREEYNIYGDPLDPNYEFTPGYSMGDYVDFSIPWNLSFNYGWSLRRSGLKPEEPEDRSLTHTLGVRGDFSLTQKWKIGFNTGYDFFNKTVTMTNLNLHRDLHCWEMRFTMVPFGIRQQYSFTIKAKASLLRDLKWDKKQSWRDNF